MEISFESLRNITTLIVNGHATELNGIGNANKGLLTSRMNNQFKFAIEILAPMMIVGYPTYSEYKDHAIDLFKPSTSNGGYKYQRKYSFTNGAVFNSYHNILVDNKSGELRGTFQTSDFPENTFYGDWRVCDLVETFIPRGPGVIGSIMAVEWNDGDKQIHASIESTYYLNHNLPLKKLHWRHVKFKTEHRPDCLYVQSEKITVFNELDFGIPFDQFEAVSMNTDENKLIRKTG